MTPEELKIVLDKHIAYLHSELGGARANLRGADLRSAYLYGADLSGADLRSADLRGANLSGADMRSADLRGANLSSACLHDANLRGAHLCDANLSGANLSGANLSGADVCDADLSGAYLYGADLIDADLYDADLSDADLRHANLYGAGLRGANLENALLPHFQILPEFGAFVGWKKAKAADTGESAVLMLEIPAEAERTSTLVGRKCRASSALVVAAYRMDGNDHPATEFVGPYYDAITYRVGEYVECPDFDPDIRIECTRGIHFFLTRKEAEDFV